MIRGTTPTFIFKTESDCTEFDKLDITFAQADTVILSKGIDDVEIRGTEILITLSERETLLFDSDKNPVEIQIRAGIGGKRFASDIMATTAQKILKDGCLT